VAEDKEKVVTRRVENLSEDVVDLGEKVTKLTLDLEKEQILRKKLRKTARVQRICHQAT